MRGSTICTHRQALLGRSKQREKMGERYAGDKIKKYNVLIASIIRAMSKLLRQKQALSDLLLLYINLLYRERLTHPDDGGSKHLRNVYQFFKKLHGVTLHTRSFMLAAVRT
jgi:hypothetical protein